MRKRIKNTLKMLRIVCAIVFACMLIMGSWALDFLQHMIRKIENSIMYSIPIVLVTRLL